MTDSVLRALVDLRDRQIQKGRIQFQLRLDAIQRGADQSNGQQIEIVTRWMDHFAALESELDQDIAVAVATEPVYNDLVALKGIGPLLSAKLIAMIDIQRANTVSALWRYAGYAVINGKRERPVKGEKLHYNKRLKTTLYLVASSFLRCNSPYRAIYDDARDYYQANRPDWTKGHQHRAALRKMIKVFLAHLWERWRIVEGLPTRRLYVHEKLGHQHIHQASDFGWPVMS